ncbi:Pre-mRNA-splicing factor cwc26 [Diatrype stigma]|uniref:Pre-mRNA-splicing factor cwc26 n=1 Tax=Diatrype stigma TaxID=117547 RepID=A0AAN9UCJ8_9PEZI
MPSDLSTYLATRYLTADPKPSTKKRKRKQQPGGGGDEGLLITDDADSAWARPSNADDDDVEASVAGTSAEFRKAKKSSWKVVGGAPPPSNAATTTIPQQQDETQKDEAAADAILSSAAAESRSGGGHDGDEAPAVLMMTDGTHAGLQSASAVSAQLERRRRAERAEFEATNKKNKQQGEAETVYRDATGRRVDLAWKRAEARRALDEVAERDEAARRALRGAVQERERAARREALEDAKTMAVARGADDEALNEELRGVRRWGDTMAEFVGGGEAGGVGGGGKGGGGKRMKGARRPVYQGAAQPNRYGIKPGYRWDGVDRGNGFEAERFKAINRRERNKGLEYSWQMDE